jgi:hypothetical protein
MKIDVFYNKLIIVGNGFDLAHGLKTSYKDFIDDFWEKEKQKVISSLDRKTKETYVYYSYNDEFISMISPYAIDDLPNSLKPYEKGYKWFANIASYKQTRNLSGNNIKFKVEYKNNFLRLITEKYYFQNWSDIEAEYYFALKLCLNNKWSDGIEKLNDDFLSIQKALEEYLTIQTENIHPTFPKILENLLTIIDITNTENLQTHLTAGSILFLSFNYTNTVNTYINTYFKNYSIDIKCIHIHGELNNPNNRIIFGYGDEIDDNYKLIENLDDNKYLKNAKSMKYQETENYKNMLSFIDSKNYQIFIMGHSCGISDRTLLNTLFEHKNCKSIKVFYHKWEDGTDNYSDLVMNISRNFTNNALMRRILVSKTSSETL